MEDDVPPAAARGAEGGGDEGQPLVVRAAAVQSARHRDQHQPAGPDLGLLLPGPPSLGETRLCLPGQGKLEVCVVSQLTVLPARSSCTGTTLSR